MPIPFRSLARRTALAVLAGAGCSQQPLPEPAGPPVPAVAIAPASAAPDPKPEAQPPAPAPPPEFRFTPDLTGAAVAKAVTPAAPAKLPAERTGAEPKPRPVPAKYLDPDSLPRAAHTLPPVPPAKAPPAKPAALAEKVPLALGAGADAPPARVALPVSAVATARTRDPNLPPPAPQLGRQTADRVPFDDPTGEVGNAAVVAGAAPVPLGVSGFLKLTVPDPFELAEQVKPNVPPAAEPSAKPVEVNPARVK